MPTLSAPAPDSRALNVRGPQLGGRGHSLGTVDEAEAGWLSSFALSDLFPLSAIDPSQLFSLQGTVYLLRWSLLLLLECGKKEG